MKSLLLLKQIIIFFELQVVQGSLSKISETSTIESIHDVNIKVSINKQPDNERTTPVTTTKDVEELKKAIGDSKVQWTMLIYGSEISSISLELFKRQEQYFIADLPVRYANKTSPIQDLLNLALDDCIFIGKVKGDRTSKAEINLCDGVSGKLTYANSSVDTDFWSVSKQSKVSFRLKYHKTREVSDKKNEMRSKRELVFPNTAKKLKKFKRYIELYISIDHSLYVSLNSSIQNSIRRALRITNEVNSFFTQFNIFVVLIGIEIWDTTERIVYETDSDSVNSKWLLGQFTKYRERHIWMQYNDVSVLITNRQIEGVKDGHQGAICSTVNSTIVISDFNTNATAARMANGLGHLLGLPHIDQNQNIRCRCVKASCIMSFPFGNSFLYNIIISNFA